MKDLTGESRHLKSLVIVFVVVAMLALSSGTAVLGDEEKLIERHLVNLDGGRNFRDIGGISTSDGRTIKPGLLYRAGVLHHLTSDDYRIVESLGIRTLLDFRDTEERINEPTEWKAGDVRVMAWDYSLDFGLSASDEGEAGVEALFASLMTEPDAAEHIMIALYRTMVEQQKPQFQGLFQTMLDGEGPVLFHCTAGKDRTGIAAALIQTALGVDRDTVFQDFTLSETVLTMAAEQQSAGAMTAHGYDETYAMLAMLPEESVAALMGTRPAYLEAAFNEMTKRYGSVDAYIRDGLGVTDVDLQTLKSLYLE